MTSAVSSVVCVDGQCYDTQSLSCLLECGHGVTPMPGDTATITGAAGDTVSFPLQACAQPCSASGYQPTGNGAFIIPHGDIAAFGAPTISYGDADYEFLTYTVTDNTTTQVIASGTLISNSSDPGSCGSPGHNVVSSSTSIGPFGDDTTLQIFLTDEGACNGSCNYTYSSGGPHSLIQSPAPNQFFIAFSDSIVCSCDETCTNQPTGFDGCTSNAFLSLAIGPPGTTAPALPTNCGAG
jgi:hypothetical protein